VKNTITPENGRGKKQILQMEKRKSEKKIKHNEHKRKLNQDSCVSIIIIIIIFVPLVFRST